MYYSLDLVPRPHPRGGWGPGSTVGVGKGRLHIVVLPPGRMNARSAVRAISSEFLPLL
jgi:hypothetical protein